MNWYQVRRNFKPENWNIPTSQFLLDVSCIYLFLLPHRRRRSDERGIDSAVMNFFRIGFLFILIVIFSSFPQARSEIITLTSETFSDKVLWRPQTDSLNIIDLVWNLVFGHITQSKPRCNKKRGFFEIKSC